jgi:hypothetical protein
MVDSEILILEKKLRGGSRIGTQISKKWLFDVQLHNSLSMSI